MITTWSRKPPFSALEDEGHHVLGQDNKRGAEMKHRTLFAVMAMTALTALAVSPSSAAQGGQDTERARIVTFDVPGAGTGSGQGTQALTLNPSNAIAGWYIDGNNTTHGFLRAPDGRFARFDARGRAQAAARAHLP